IALAETAHSGAAAVEEALVNWNCRDIAGAFRKRPDQTGAGAELEQGFSKRDEVTRARGRPKILDLASDRTGGEFEGLIKDETAARHDRAVAQIEGVKKANRTDEVIHVTKEIIIDIGADTFDAPLCGEKANLILLGGFIGKLPSRADFKLRITVIIEGQSTQPNLEFDVTFEKM